MQDSIKLTPKTDGNPYNVLVVEDSDLNQMMAENVFESLGCNLEVVHDGQTAYDRVKQNSYDIIFMDCKLPQVDGYQATELIRDYQSSFPSMGRTPIVALTSQVMSKDKERCFNAGMDDYLSKPIRMDSVCHMINKWCANHTDIADVW